MVDTQKVLMIIEDDPDNLDALTMYFSSEGFLVRIANNRNAALGILQQYEMPDVILSDWYMPGMSVEDFVQAARKLDPMAEILIMSASDDVVQNAQKLKLDYIRKPPHLPELHRRVEDSLKRRRESRGTEQ